MIPKPRSDGAPLFAVELTEWDRLDPTKERLLRGLSLAGDPQSRRLAEKLRGRLDIRDGYDGLEIESSSFVGRVDVGPLRVAIRPKLPAMPLARLLRYAYGLRDLAVINETHGATTRLVLHDLLIALLASEVEELLHRGLVRRYVPLSEALESPRGRLLVDEVIRHGGVRRSTPSLSAFRAPDRLAPESGVACRPGGGRAADRGSRALASYATANGSVGRHSACRAAG